MHSTLDILIGCLFLLPTTPSGDLKFPDAPASSYGGLIIVRQGDRTTWMLGGGLLPRHVKVVTAAPEGAVVTRFKLPANAQQSSNLAPLFENARPAGIWIEVPEEFSTLYVEGELVRGQGKKRALLSPPLNPGASCSLRLRVTSLVGANFVVEDRQILIRAGDVVNVTFDGSSALVTPLTQFAPAK